MQGSDDLEAVRNIVNGWYGVVALGQASRTPLSAVWAPQFFVPTYRSTSWPERLRAFRLFVGSVPDSRQPGLQLDDALMRPDLRDRRDRQARARHRPCCDAAWSMGFGGPIKRHSAGRASRLT